MSSSGGIILSDAEIAALQNTAAGGTTAVTDPTSAAAGAGSAPTPSSTNSTDRRREVRWAPDNSTYIFADEHPNAFWQDYQPAYLDSPEVKAGFYTPSFIDMYGERQGGQLITPFRGEYNVWNGGYDFSNTPDMDDLRADGMFDLGDVDGSTWDFMQADINKTKFAGDVRSDPKALFHSLSRMYATDPRSNMRNGYQGLYDDLVGAGFDDQTARAFADTMTEQALIARRSDDDAFKVEDVTKDIVSGLAEIAQVPPIRAMLIAMSMGGSEGAVEGASAVGSEIAAEEAASQTAMNMLGEELAAGAPELAGAFSMDATTGLAGAAGSGMFNSGGPAWLQTGPQLSGPASVVNPAGGSVFVPDAATAAQLGGGATLSAPSVGITDILGGSQIVAPELAEETGGSIFQNIENVYDTVQPYVKLAQQVKALFGGEDAPDAPTRDEGESVEQYSQELVEYMNLDAAAMAEMGLQPGSPEYMSYILQQADAIIAQITEGMDVDAEDLSEQLRTKTEEELTQLRRALHVRGTLDQLMGEGTYTDPFSGTDQEVVGGGMFNPNVAAYQRGLAGTFQNVARTGGDAAMEQINALLNRNPDLFGMQGRADEAYQQALLADDERRRRGGMLAF